MNVTTSNLSASAEAQYQADFGCVQKNLSALIAKFDEMLKNSLYETSGKELAAIQGQIKQCKDYLGLIVGKVNRIYLGISPYKQLESHCASKNPKATIEEVRKFIKSQLVYVNLSPLIQTVFESLGDASLSDSEIEQKYQLLVLLFDSGAKSDNAIRPFRFTNCVKMDCYWKFLALFLERTNNDSETIAMVASTIVSAKPELFFQFFEKAKAQPTLKMTGALWDRMFVSGTTLWAQEIKSRVDFIAKFINQRFNFDINYINCAMFLRYIIEKGKETGDSELTESVIRTMVYFGSRVPLANSQFSPKAPLVPFFKQKKVIQEKALARMIDVIPERKLLEQLDYFKAFKDPLNIIFSYMSIDRVPDLTLQQKLDCYATCELIEKEEASQTQKSLLGSTIKEI